MSTQSRNACRRKCKPEFGGKRGRGENFLRRQLCIYRGEGGSSANTPRFDRCEVSGGRVSTPTFRGWRFFTEFLRFSWNWIVGVNPLPRGVSVGEFRKTYHPRNVDVYEICVMSFQEHRTHEDLESWTCEASKSRTCEDLESWTCEASKSRTCEDLESWTCEASKSRTCNDLESRTCEAPKSRTREDSTPWTCEIMKSGVCEIQESVGGQVRKSRRAEIFWTGRFTNQ
jgi:hypothetical protein